MKIALTASLVGNAGAPGKGFDGDFVQALALFARRTAQRVIEVIRHVSNGVLHAFIVGTAG